MPPSVIDHEEPPSIVIPAVTPVIKVDEVEPEPPVNNENEHRQRDPGSGPTLTSTGGPPAAPFTLQQREQSLPMVSNMNNVNNQHQSPIKKPMGGIGLPHPTPIVSHFAVKKAPESVWDHEERRKVETRNNNMRQTIYKEVKRPGRNYDRLLELLKELHGPADIRQQYIFDVIKEATRFKRNHMAKIILQHMPSLVSAESTS